jgi:hypothetical protein
MTNPSDDGNRRGNHIRDVGVYTVIPAMLIVGPVMGWLAGRWAAGRWGHDSTFETAGALLGFAAAVRQIQLIIQRESKRQKRNGP